MPRAKGSPKTGGRKRGTPNKATRAWKDFVAEQVNDPKQQQALADAIKARPELLFKAAEHAVGKPRQTLELNQGEFKMIVWPDNEDIAE